MTKMGESLTEMRRVLEQFHVDIRDASPESVEQGWALLQMCGCDCYRHDITNLLDGGTATRVVGFITEQA